MIDVVDTGKEIPPEVQVAIHFHAKAKRWHKDLS
jgi:hypothetical protein